MRHPYRRLETTFLSAVSSEEAGKVSPAVSHIRVNRKADFRIIMCEMLSLAAKELWEKAFGAIQTGHTMAHPGNAPVCHMPADLSYQAQAPLVKLGKALRISRVKSGAAAEAPFPGDTGGSVLKLKKRMNHCVGDPKRCTVSVRMN